MITQIDFIVLNAVQNLRCGILDTVMPAITYLGSGGIVWLGAAVIMLFFKRSRKAGISLIAALGIGWLLSTCGLKEIIARPRPFNTEGGLLSAADLLIGIPSGTFSFPSGHALSSFSAAAVLFSYSKKIGIPALVLAVLISFSRLYLYVHFPSDILAGALLGVLLAIFAVRIIDRITENKSEKQS